LRKNAMPASKSAEDLVFAIDDRALTDWQRNLRVGQSECSSADIGVVEQSSDDRPGVVFMVSPRPTVVDLGLRGIA